MRITNAFENEVFLGSRITKEKANLNISWYYPNSYAVGMAGLGYQLVWRILNEDDETIVRRGFTDIEEECLDTNELCGFTLAWELDFVNIVKILARAKISPLAVDRTDDEPIVFGGGPVLTANPEPFADFFDVILLGDAEAVIPKFLKAYKQVRQCKSRYDKLLNLAQISGVYVPQFYQYDVDTKGGAAGAVFPALSFLPTYVHKQVFLPPSDYVAHSMILSPDTTWGDMFLVEVARSCPQECRFCLASFLTRPFRATKESNLMQAIDLGLKHTNKIGLLGPSVTEHPQFERIAQALLERPNTKISIASVRADTLTEPILRMLKNLGQRSVTIAIETGSERLRSIVKKNLTEAEIIKAVELISQSGLNSVKFYGMVGLPHETWADLDETVRLFTQLRKQHRKLKIVFSVSSFVPKAQTPFQWYGRDRESQAKMEYIRKKIAPLGVEVRMESSNWSDIQALLSRGDRRLTPILQHIAQTSGSLGAWKKTMRNMPAHCPQLDFFVFRDIPDKEKLPWSHLVDENKADYLHHHLEATRNANLLTSNSYLQYND